LKVVVTSVWSFIILLFSSRIMSLLQIFPLFDNKGLIVGQKSLDFGPPMHLS
jgi:hypothetical protein